MLFVVLTAGAVWIGAAVYHNHPDGGRSRFRENVEELRTGKTNFLFLNGMREADALLEEIQGMPEIENVFIDSSDISMVGMRYLATLPNLKMLEAYYSLHDTGVCDEGMLELRNCKKLKVLVIYGGLTDEGITEINRQMPNVRVITKHE